MPRDLVCGELGGVGGGVYGVGIGTGSEVARWQFIRDHAASHLIAQHRTLQRLFWLQSWSGCHAAVFRVPSPIHPADPYSCLVNFPSKGAAKREAEERKLLWQQLPRPYSPLVHIPQAHWRSR